MKNRKLLKGAIGMMIIAVMALTLFACGDTTEPTTEDASKTSTDSTDKPDAGADTTKKEETPKSQGPITIVWYPNESAADYQAARDEYAKLITQATGRKVEHKLTTDYAIAIEAIASGTAQISFMGAQGYIEANNKSKDVKPLFVNSGVSGTLKDAIYYSWFTVNKGQETEYKTATGYAIDKVESKKMSFVSNSSTSGFKVPSNVIMTQFSKADKWKKITADDLVEGGKDKFFSEVLFGGSHQGSAVNLLTGKADVAAFCDTELAPYAKLSSGDENKTGAVYEIKADASAPFNQMVGKQFFIIKSTPVLNGPFAYNAKTLSADDVKKIQTLFTSSEVTNNPLMFVKKDSGLVGMFKKTDKECFLTVEDSWYNPIREMK